MDRLTKEQAIVLTGYTGVLMCEWIDFHDDICKRWNDPYVSDGALSTMQKEIEKTYKEDFDRLIGA